MIKFIKNLVVFFFSKKKQKKFHVTERFIEWYNIASYSPYYFPNIYLVSVCLCAYLLLHSIFQKCRADFWNEIWERAQCLINQKKVNVSFGWNLRGTQTEAISSVSNNRQKSKILLFIVQIIHSKVKIMNDWKKTVNKSTSIWWSGGDFIHILTSHRTNVLRYKILNWIFFFQLTLFTFF